MGRGLRRAYLLILGATLRAASAAACEVPDVPAALARAEAAERAHAAGRAIELRTRLLACPLGDGGVANTVALSRDHAAVGDHARAAAVAESLAEREVDRASGGAAPLVDPRELEDPLVRAAMAEAFDARLALRDMDDARSDALWLLRAEGATEANVERAAALGAAWEGAGAWPAALQWYRHLAGAYGGRAQWRASVRALAGMARAYEALGAHDLAVRSWEAVLARWPAARARWPALRAITFSPWRIAEAPPVPPRAVPARDAEGPLLHLGDGQILRPFRPAAGVASDVVSLFGGMTEVGVDNVNLNEPLDFDDPYLACFAEARFRLAHEAARRAMADTAPMYAGPPDSAVYDLWVARILTPWVNRYVRRLRNRVAVQLTEVVNLHVARWEIAAYAVLASSFLGFAERMRSSPPPPQFQWSRRELLDAWNVLR